MWPLVEVTIRARRSLTPFTYDDLRAAVLRGRAYLVKQQIEDGSWPETTRPAQQESYAQRISTTAWATLALFETSGYVERNGERLRVRRSIGPLESVHFERAADPVPRAIFEH